MEEKIDMLIEKWNEISTYLEETRKDYNKAMKWFFRGLGTGIVTGVLCACIFGLFLLLVNK